MEEEIIKALKEHDLNPIMLNFEEYAECIENLIARNKELEKLSENIKMFRDNNLSSEIDYVIALKSNFMEYLKTDYIPKSKVRELYEHYKDTGYYELESVLQELLEERN